MTREETKEVDILRELWRFSVSEKYTDKEIREALDKAIEALKEERPHGEWEGETEKHNLYTRICSSCGSRGVVGYFCMWCGAKM